MKTSDIRTIRKLLIILGGIYFVVIILGSIVLPSIEPNLNNQIDSISIALVTAVSGGINEFEFTTDSSKNLRLVFAGLGGLGWALVVSVIVIYAKGKGSALPDTSGGFNPKK